MLRVSENELFAIRPINAYKRIRVLCQTLFVLVS